MSSPLSEPSDDVKSPPAQTGHVSDRDHASSPTAEDVVPPSTKLDNMFDNDDDNDDDVVPRRRKVEATQDSDDELEDEEGAAGDDLFGEESDEEMGEAGNKTRTLDDNELNSDDDEGGRGSKYETVEEIETHKEVEMGLHPLPLSYDEQTYLLKIPQFLSIAPTEFQAESFDFVTPPDPAITPYNYATTAVRWRHSPKNPSHIESNSRIIKWSDGSMSLQIATSKELYDLPSNQIYPSDPKRYNAADDSFTYIAEPLATSGVVRLITHATQSLAVVPASNVAINDDIKHLLASRYKAAQRKEVVRDTTRTVELSYKMEDPEKARREAEQAEKEQTKFNKKLQLEKEKAEDVDGLGRSRGSTRYNKSSQSGGRLTVDALEDDERERPRRKNNFPNKGSRRRQDAEDRAVSKRIHEEEYDMDDGFLTDDPSDSEESGASSEDEEEEFESKKRKKSSKKSKSSRHREEKEVEEEDEEEEAEFTDDEEVAPKKATPVKAREPSVVSERDDDDEEDLPSAAPDRKRRKVVADDSDEEE